MSSLTNPFFHKNRELEQNLIDGFVRESIQIMGETYYYLPRDVQIENLILGEDVISKFKVAIPIEMYLTDSQGFQGDKEMFSKFGLEIRNSYKLVVHKTRWEYEIASQFDNNQFEILNESGASKILLESGLVLHGENITSEAIFDIENYIRPREGDLIYDPITKFLLEIKFVDHDVEFFALGRNYQYYLSCEAFQYNNEEIDTGVEHIDLFALNSKDLLDNQLLAENGVALIYEQGGYILLDVTPIPAIRESGTDFSPGAIKVKSTVINPFV